MAARGANTQCDTECHIEYSMQYDRRTHRIHRLCRVLVQPHKLLQQECAGRVVVRPAPVLGERLAEGRVRELGPEQVDLVEEEDDGCFGEPPDEGVSSGGSDNEGTIRRDTVRYGVIPCQTVQW